MQRLWLACLLLPLACLAGDDWLRLVEQARSYAQTKDYKRAEQYASQALELIVKNGETSKGARAYTNLVMARIYDQQGLSPQAEPYYREAYVLGRGLEAAGEQLPFSLGTVCADFGNVLREVQKLDEAGQVLKSCANSGKWVVNGEDMDVVTTQLYTLMQQSKFTEAESIASAKLATMRENGHQDSLGQVAVMHALAKSIQNQEKGKRWREAAVILRDALKICQGIPSTDGLNCANVEVDYADALGGQSKFEEAESYATHAYQVRKAALGEEHPYTAAAAMLMGKLQFFQGNYEAALPTLRYVHTVFKKTYGPKNAYMNSVHSLLVDCLRKLGKNSEAARLERETGLWVVR